MDYRYIHMNLYYFPCFSFFSLSAFTNCHLKKNKENSKNTEKTVKKKVKQMKNPHNLYNSIMITPNHVYHELWMDCRHINMNLYYLPCFSFFSLSAFTNFHIKTAKETAKNIKKQQLKSQNNWKIHITSIKVIWSPPNMKNNRG